LGGKPPVKLIRFAGGGGRKVGKNSGIPEGKKKEWGGKGLYVAPTVSRGGCAIAD